MYPYVMTIAGFDPCAGAGILADIKTFEAHKTYGFGIITANTIQNDIEFDSINWIDENEIIKQIDISFKRFDFEYVKIGIIENFDILRNLVLHLKKLNPQIKIIWDPVLKASAGFIFHSKIEEKILFSVLRDIYLITPNLDEIKILFGSEMCDVSNLQLLINKYKICLILLKGGHAKGNKINDVLILKNNSYTIEGERFNGYNKHGTGCVLSSAIVANLANNNDLPTSCKKAKNYIHKFIKSNNTNLGWTICEQLSMNNDH